MPSTPPDSRAHDIGRRCKRCALLLWLVPSLLLNIILPGTGSLLVGRFGTGLLQLALALFCWLSLISMTPLVMIGIFGLPALSIWAAITVIQQGTDLWRHHAGRQQ